MAKALTIRRDNNHNMKQHNNQCEKKIKKKRSKNKSIAGTCTHVLPIIEIKLMKHPFSTWNNLISVAFQIENWFVQPN